MKHWDLMIVGIALGYVVIDSAIRHNTSLTIVAMAIFYAWVNWGR